MIDLTEPPPSRFKRHVGFDNIPAAEATKSNTSSLTLNFRHQGYHPGRRSRTFMVGVDEHAYSDYALRWLLENMVDDGDEVICVRVIETPIRDKSYHDEAVKMMHRIQDMNTLNRAISIVLEYSVGKLHATFQQLVSGQPDPVSQKHLFRKGCANGGYLSLCRYRYIIPVFSSWARADGHWAAYKASSIRETRSPNTASNTVLCR